MEKFDQSRYEFGLQGEEKVANYYKQHGYAVETCKEHFGKDWTPVLDKQNGDLFVTKSNEIYQIDVKRAKDSPGMHYEFGTITYGASYDDVFQSNDKAWYALLDQDMTAMHLLKATELYGKKPENSRFWKSSELKDFVAKRVEL